MKIPKLDKCVNTGPSQWEGTTPSLTQHPIPPVLGAKPWSPQPLTQLARKAIDYGERTQNKGYYAVQGHSRSSRMVSVKNPKASITSYLVPFRSYRSLLFKFSTLRVLQPPFGGLTSVNWTFFARCYGWGATSEYRWLKIDISRQRGPFDQKISGRRGRPPPTILLLIKLGYMILRML